MRVWRRLVLNAFSTVASNRLDAAGYFVGKLIRFAFFWLFILAVFRFTTTIAGYSKYETLLFFLTFNLVDVGAQVFFRGIYLLKYDVRRGNFDYTLTKPIHPLFYTMTRLTDLLDLIFLLPILTLLIYVIAHLPTTLTLTHIATYIMLILLGLGIILAIHIISAAITISTVESDQFLWLYRETIGIGRFPPDIFHPPIQFIFTYLLPIIVAISFPAKALLGALTPNNLTTALFMSLMAILLALFVWHKSLRHYSSASS